MVSKIKKYKVVLELILVELVIEKLKMGQKLKVNRASGMDFLIRKVKTAFLAYESPLLKHQFFIILI